MESKISSKGKAAALCLAALATLSALASCSSDDDVMASQPGPTDPTPADTAQATAVAAIADGLKTSWSEADSIIVFAGWQATITSALAPQTAELASPLLAVYPTGAASSVDGEALLVKLADSQTAADGGYDPNAAILAARSEGDTLLFRSAVGGIRLNFQMSGVTKVEIESVDGYALAGTASIAWGDASGAPTVSATADSASIITFCAPDTAVGFTPGEDYFVSTLPCNVYGGYRLSIFKDGLVAHYFGVHQTIGRAEYISPADLDESALEFDDPEAPLVEEERPELDATTNALLRAYMANETEENRQALLAQMGIRYDKVVARKKAKLRELEREAKTQGVIDEMKEIVDEMVENRDIRLEQQLLRLIDPRTDDNAADQWMVLRGADGDNPYIAYAPTTNAEYQAFDPAFDFAAGQENYPAVGITIAQAEAYCAWLAANDSRHSYRLPTEEDWILAAGHMPKDVSMNAGGVETGLTAVDAYAQTTGTCGGIDFWGNCWEWTSTTDANGNYIIKGGAWDSERDDCRSEKSDDVRDGSRGYANVGFRVVRTD